VTPPGESVGRRTHHTEHRVSGAGPHGEWDHGWRRQSLDAADAHARRMLGEDVPWARVQTRTVETEILLEHVFEAEEALSGVA